MVIPISNINNILKKINKVKHFNSRIFGDKINKNDEI